MKELVIEIPGVPKAKMRHRSFVRNGKMMQCDLQSKEKEAFAWDLTRALRESFDHENKQTSMAASEIAWADAYCIDLSFHMPYPQSKPKTSQNAFLWGLEVMNTKPDLDNLEKFVLDCARGILFKDDNQVVEIKSRKVYSLNPRTVIRVKPTRKIDIHDTAKEILQTMSPGEFRDMVFLAQRLSKLSSIMDEKSESLADLNESYPEVIESVAAVISMMAEKYASVFTKIKKNCPNFYEEYHRLNECKAALQNKETQ